MPLSSKLTFFKGYFYIKNDRNFSGTKIVTITKPRQLCAYKAPVETFLVGKIYWKHYWYTTINYDKAIVIDKASVTCTYNFRKKHCFKDSKTRECFFIKDPRWNMKNFKADMKNIETAYKTTN